MNENREPKATPETIGKHTKVNLAVLVAVVLTFMSGTAEWADLRFHQEQAWTIGDQQTWTFEFQKLNPSVNVPEVERTTEVTRTENTNATLAEIIKP